LATDRAFSQFVTKELAAASNIKNRVNRRTVIRTLTRIREWSTTNKILESGVIIFAGIDEYDSEVFWALEPRRKFTGMVYDCSSKFQVDSLREYLEDSGQSGTIIFASGQETLIYDWNSSEFKRTARIDGLLINRKKVGGYSANRYARLAEESRTGYVTRVIDSLRIFGGSVGESSRIRQCHLFGSSEICEMILESTSSISSVSVTYYGFLEFDIKTIGQTGRWLEYLQAPNPSVQRIRTIIECLNSDIDRLDFGIDQRDTMEYYLINPGHPDLPPGLESSTKRTDLLREMPEFAQLRGFAYIGVKYYSAQTIPFED
jgi:hypothetical protein